MQDSKGSLLLSPEQRHALAAKLICRVSTNIDSTAQDVVDMTGCTKTDAIVEALCAELAMIVCMLREVMPHDRVEEFLHSLMRDIRYLERENEALS